MLARPAAGDLAAPLDSWLDDLSRKGTRTSLAELREGAELLWNSANTLAMRGEFIPYELPSVVLLIKNVDPGTLNEERSRRLADALRRYAEELVLRIRRPDALGKVTVEPGGTYSAGDHGEVRQTYRLGDAAMGPGSAFLLATPWLTGVPLQADRPGSANFVSVTTSRQGVRFVPRQVRRGGIHGGFKSADPLLVMEVRQGTLQPGDVVEFRYGDRSRGSPGMQLPTVAGDTLLLPIYVRLGREGGYLSLPAQPVTIEGAEPAAVRGFMPSVAAPGEEIAMTVASFDRFGNRASGRIPSYELLLGGTFVRRVVENYTGVSRVEGLQFAAPGVYRYEIRSSGGGIVGHSNPLQIREASGRRIYWGNLHAHTDLTDGVGSVEGYFRSAREEDALTFAALPEHDRWLDRWEWERLRGTVEREEEGRSFAPYLGFEWSMPTRLGGHQQVIFADTDSAQPIFSQETNTLSDLYYRLRAAQAPDRVLVIATGHLPGDWRLADPRLLSLVEVASEMGAFQWLGDLYAGHGYRVGFVASSANHAAHPAQKRFGGITAVSSADPSREGIFRALKERRTYATTGARMLLDFRVNDGAMGERVAYDTRRWIRGEVSGSAPISEIVLFKNGKLLSRERGDRASAGRAPGATLAVAVEFYSDSAPFMNLRDLPRQEREWLGYVQFTGCDEIVPLGQRSSAERFAVNRAAANRADFLLHTRGEERGIALELRGVRDSLEMELYVRQGHEAGDDLPLTRPASETPALRQRIALNELLRGEVVRRVNVNGYNDQITVRLIDTDPPATRKFERIDDQDSRPGDYYYVRVRQEDGHYAWSSPIWVGGEDVR